MPVSHSERSAIPGTCPQPAPGTAGAVIDLAECEPKAETSAAAFSADLLQAFFETRPVRGIELRGASHFLDLGRFERADHPDRSAHDQRMFRKLLALGDHGARANDTAAADA